MSSSAPCVPAPCSHRCKGDFDLHCLLESAKLLHFRSLPLSVWRDNSISFFNLQELLGAGSTRSWQLLASGFFVRPVPMELHLPSSLPAITEQQKEKTRAFVSVHEPSAQHCPGQASLPGRTLRSEGIFNCTFHLALITVPSFAVSRGGLTDIEGEQLLRSHQSSAIRIQLPRPQGHPRWEISFPSEAQPSSCPSPTAALALPHSGQGGRLTCKLPLLTVPLHPASGLSDHYGDK